MTRNSAKTMIERAGFRDPDLGSPKHDAIIKWIEANLDAVLQESVKHESWSQENIEKRIASAHSIMFKTPLERDIATNPNIQKALKLFGGEVVNGQPCEPPLATIPDERPITVLDRKWEYAITQRGSIVGFVDYAVHARIPVLALSEEGGCKWNVVTADEKVFFEAKTSIKSIGELIRQIRYYQNFQRGIYVVVSPDDSCQETLRNQGIKFVKCPDPVIDARGQQSLFK